MLVDVELMLLLLDVVVWEPEVDVLEVVELDPVAVVDVVAELQSRVEVAINSDLRLLALVWRLLGLVLRLVTREVGEAAGAADAAVAEYVIQEHAELIAETSYIGVADGTIVLPARYPTQNLFALGLPRIFS